MIDEVIIAHYINIDGLTRQQAQQMVSDYFAHEIQPLNLHKDIKNIYLPVIDQPTKIEVVFDGRNVNTKSRNNLIKFVKIIEKIIKDHPDSWERNEMRKLLRSFKLKSILC